MSFLFINKTLWFNHLNTRTAMNPKISAFVICEGIKCLLLYNLQDFIFKAMLKILAFSVSRNKYLLLFWENWSLDRLDLSHIWALYVVVKTQILKLIFFSHLNL